MPQKKSKQQPKEGRSAIRSMISYSKDQAVGFARNRYAKKGGMKQIAADISELRAMLNVEDKQVVDLTGTTTVTAAAPLVQALGSVAQGSNSNNRTGNSIKVTRVDLIMGFAYSTGTVATTALQNQYFNWYVVRYLKTPSSNGATPFGIGDFLGSDPNSNNTVLSLPNNDLNEDFHILASGEVEVDLTFSATNPTSRFKVVNLTIPCSFHQTFNGTAASNIVDNALFLVVTAINPINTGGASTLINSARIWYIDN
jgi:hypothetical protein